MTLNKYTNFKQHVNVHFWSSDFNQNLYVLFLVYIALKIRSYLWLRNGGYILTYIRNGFLAPFGLLGAVFEKISKNKKLYIDITSLSCLSKNIII